MRLYLGIVLACNNVIEINIIDKESDTENNEEYTG